MSPLVAMVCDIDDFCKVFEPIDTQRLLQNGPRQRRRQRQLRLSEMMTIIVSFHRRPYRDVKPDDTESVEGHLRPDFADLVSYSRFVDLMPRARVPRCRDRPPRQGGGTGITFVESTPLVVWHTQRLGCHPVLEGDATRGKCSMGW